MNAFQKKTFHISMTLMHKWRWTRGDETSWWKHREERSDRVLLEDWCPWNVFRCFRFPRIPQESVHEMRESPPILTGPVHPVKFLYRVIYYFYWNWISKSASLLKWSFIHENDNHWTSSTLTPSSLQERSVTSTHPETKRLFRSFRWNEKNTRTWHERQGSVSVCALRGISYRRNYGRGEGLITVINPARTSPRRERRGNEVPPSEFWGATPSRSPPRRS